MRVAATPPLALPSRSKPFLMHPVLPTRAGTPADKLLAMMTELLDGSLPSLQDILLIQSTILESRNIYQPFRLGKQLLEAKELEVGCRGDRGDQAAAVGAYGDC
jgi:hypothetical protein